MTSTAFQEGPHFQDIEIYKGAYNLYTNTIQKKRNSQVFADLVCEPLGKSISQSLILVNMAWDCRVIAYSLKHFFPHIICRKVWYFPFYRRYLCAFLSHVFANTYSNSNSNSNLFSEEYYKTMSLNF